MKTFLTSLAMIIPHLNSKANNETNGNLDPSQMMGKSSFLLSKNSKISPWICICLWRTIAFQWINGSNGWLLSNRTWILHNYSKSTRMQHTQTNCISFWTSISIPLILLLPHITGHNDLRLLLQMSSRNTLQYISE